MAPPEELRFAFGHTSKFHQSHLIHVSSKPIQYEPIPTPSSPRRETSLSISFQWLAPLFPSTRSPWSNQQGLRVQLHKLSHSSPNHQTPNSMASGFLTSPPILPLVPSPQELPFMPRFATHKLFFPSIMPFICHLCSLQYRL